MGIQKELTTAGAPAGDFAAWRKSGRAAIVKRPTRENAIPSRDTAEASLQTGDTRSLALYLRDTRSPDPHLLAALADLLDPLTPGDRKLVFRRRASRRKSGKSDRALSQVMLETENPNTLADLECDGGHTRGSAGHTRVPLETTGGRDVLRHANQIRTTIAGIAESDPEMAEALSNLFAGLELGICGED